VGDAALRGHLRPPRGRAGGKRALKREVIVKLHASFEELIHVEEETGVEFWLAWDLQEAV
jgi:hypothetical protein